MGGVERVNAAFAHPLRFGKALPSQPNRRPLLAGCLQLSLKRRHALGLWVGLRRVFHVQVHDYRQARLVGPPEEAQTPGVPPLIRVNVYAAARVTIRADLEGQPHGVRTGVARLVWCAGKRPASLFDVGPPAVIKVLALKGINH